MLTGAARPETSAPGPQHDRLNYRNGQNQGYQYFERPNYEPPRPLEPRPTLHASLSDSISMQRRQEPYPQQAGLSEHRGPGPSLPGLRDILTTGSPASRTSPYAGSWHTTHPSSSTPTQSGRPYYASSYVHPPMVLEPNAHPPREPRPRSWDVPIHQTSSDACQQSQHMPTSPYSGYPQDHGQPTESRYDLTTPNSARPLTSGVSSPYIGSALDASPFRGTVPGYDSSQPASTAENQKKYIGVKDVPGEGTFHLYEGGYRIPTHVDGEHVNPAWGLTKANKPRKRLALACLDCREKKIKCEPGATSCLQCEKAKRPCRRTQAQLAQSESAASTEWSPGPSHSRNKASVSDPTPAPTHNVEPDSLSKRRSREDPSPPSVPNKKHRSASPLPTIVRDAPLPLREGPAEDKTAAPVTGGDIISWDHDPFVAHPDITLQLLDLYFDHFNSATYCLFPRHHFMHWLKAYTDKCQNERLVLYAMLAVASNFADDSLSGFGRQCARIAMDFLPVQAATINMCTAQARVLLAIYSFAKGEYTAAWEHGGAAIRATTFLSYHTEQACLEDSSIVDQPRTEFNLSVAQYAECKRRTFWSAFFLDRYSQSTVTILKPQDIFVRLPCTEEMYERNLMSDAPYLNNGIIDPVKALLTAGSSVAPMAWHAVVASIWGDVFDFIFRAPHQSGTTYRSTYESFYVDTWNRLQGWSTRLPEYLQYSEANLNRSIQHGFADTFVSIHSLYHICCMKLNRCLRHSLAQDLVARNIRAAHYHGHQMLQMMCSVQAARRDISVPAGEQPRSFVLSANYSGYATLAAVDIVSAGESDNTLGQTLNEISGGLHCLHELSRFWNSAKDQARLCERRYYQIQNILTNPGRAQSGAWLGRRWGLEKPLETVIPAEDDCIYGLGGSAESSQIYFDAFRDGEGPAVTVSRGLRIA